MSGLLQLRLPEMEKFGRTLYLRKALGASSNSRHPPKQRRSAHAVAQSGQSHFFYGPSSNAFALVLIIVTTWTPVGTLSI